IGENIIIGSSPKREMSPIEMSTIDSLLKFALKASVSKVDEKESKLTLMFGKTPNDGETYSRIEMFYDPKTYFLSKLIFYYAQETELDTEGKVTGKPRMELAISDFSKKPQINSDLFASNKYFLSKNKQLLATNSYANFAIKDIRKKTK
ncbi:MAG TPA: hypothetical protein VF691_11605, partial [Cytophagaceae bacterium]